METSDFVFFFGHAQHYINHTTWSRMLIEFVVMTKRCILRVAIN